MSREKDLARNTIILFIGIFFTKVIQYFLLPFYTGILNTEEYGTYELFSTLITFLLPIIYLQIEQGCFRFLIDNRGKKSGICKIISNSFFFVSVINFIIIILFIPISFFITNQYKWLVLINLVINSYFMLLTQVSRGLGDNKSYSISGVINAITTILFNILFLVFFKLKVDGMLYGTFIGYLFCIFYLVFKEKIFDYISFDYIDFKEFKRIIKYSIPMIPNSISWWIFSSSDRIIVSALIGLSATGILSVAYKLSNVGIVIYNVFNMSLTESIALHIDDKDIATYFNKIFDGIGNLFVSFGTCVISILPIIFHILVNGKFDDAFGLIPIAIVATEFQVFAGMFGTIYVAKNSTKSIAITSIIAAIINIIIDLLLIPYVGIYAAVISTLVSYFVLFVYRLFDVNKKYFSICIGNSLWLNILINITIILPLFYLKNNYITIVLIFFAVCSSFVFNKKSVDILRKFFMKRGC